MNRTGGTVWRDPAHVRVAKGVQMSGTDHDDYVRKASFDALFISAPTRDAHLPCV